MYNVAHFGRFPPYLSTGCTVNICMANGDAFGRRIL